MIFVLDVETGGLDPAQHSILSLALAPWPPDSGADPLHILINEGDGKIVITPEASAVNGLTVEQLQRDGLSPEDAVWRIMDYLALHSDTSPAPNGFAVLAGQNVGNFDFQFLKRLCALTGHGPRCLALFSHRMLDTSSVLRFLKLTGFYGGEASLTDAFKYFGIDDNAAGRHTALGDAVCTAKLLTELVALVGSA